MKNIKYASYAAIDQELEILKIEKEISYQKLILSIQKAKDSLTPENIIHGFLDPYKKKIPKAYLVIIRTIAPYLINYFWNRKRR